jgi:hypothetical protein
MPVFSLLPIEDIDFITLALRPHQAGDETVTERAEDLAHNGILNVPTVYKMSNGATVMGDGATRLRAAQKLQNENRTIKGIEMGFFPCTIVDKSDDLNFTEIDVLMAQVNGNVTVVKTANKNVVDAIYHVQMAKKLPVADLAKEFGVSEKHVRQLLGTVRLPDDVRALIDTKGGITFTNAVKLEGVYGKATSKKVYGEDTSDWDGLVAQSKEMTTGDFTNVINDFVFSHEARVANMKEKAKEAGAPVRQEPTFEPKSKIMDGESLRKLFDEIKVEGTDEELSLMKRIFGLDEASVARQRATWDEKRSAAAAAAELRKGASKKVSELTAEEFEAEVARRAAASVA